MSGGDQLVPICSRSLRKIQRWFGVRSYRLMSGLFRTQARALLHASAGANSVCCLLSEVSEFVMLADEERSRTFAAASSSGPHKIALGAMIELPASSGASTNCLPLDCIFVGITICAIQLCCHLEQPVAPFVVLPGALRVLRHIVGPQTGMRFGYPLRRDGGGD